MEKHLFYLAIETWIYERCKTIEMLSTYVQPFYPFQAEDECTENIPIENRKVNDIKNSQHTILNINKQTITSIVKESTKNERPIERKSIKTKNSLL